MKIHLINSLDHEIISGGNIYNKQLVNALRNNNIHVEYPNHVLIEDYLDKIEDEDFIIIDSICLHQEVNWQKYKERKLALLLHLPPSQDEVFYKRNLDNEEAFFFKNFKTISAGKEAVDFFVKKYGETDKSLIFEPAVDDNWEEKKEHSELPKVIIVFANIIQRKGIDRLINVLSHLKHYDWTCRIFGQTTDIDYYHEMLALVSLYDLNEKITFENPVEHHLVNKHMIDSDVLFLLSDSENNSVALKESIATSLPFITTPVGNYKYFEDCKIGHITSSFQPDEIAGEIEKYFKNPSDYKKLCESVKNVKLETWSNNVSKLIDFIRS